MIPHHLSFKRLKQSALIASVLNDKGLNERFKTQGDRLVGPCPIHGGDNPHAFVVSLSKNLWYCFTKCNTGGDVIDFVRYLDKISHRQSADYLAALANIAQPQSYSSCRSSSNPFRPFPMRLNLDPFSPWLKKKGIDPATAKHFETGAYNGPGFLADCIGVRLHDLNGRPIGYAGRRLIPDQAEKYGKWKFPPRLPKKKILYNFHRIRPYLKRGLIIVEGPWSVMRFAQLNIPTVALLGISLSAAHYDIFRQTPQVILMLDGDCAGRKATVKLWQSLKAITQTHYIYLPPNLDPDDLNDDAICAALKHFSL